jgi:hypothetical protein
MKEVGSNKNPPQSDRPLVISSVTKTPWGCVVFSSDLIKKGRKGP